MNAGAAGDDGDDEGCPSLGEVLAASIWIPANGFLLVNSEEINLSEPEEKEQQGGEGGLQERDRE